MLLDVQHVTFGYGTQPLLYNVSLQVQKGEMVGLLGPNGSGKTTLLRLMSGLFRPQQGNVLLEGRTLRDMGKAWRGTTYRGCATRTTYSICLYGRAHGKPWPYAFCQAIFG